MSNNEETLTTEQKLKKYEELLAQLMEQQIKREGIVLMGPDKDFYKVKIGQDEFIVKSPLFKLKKGDSVIMIDGQVVEMTPENLVIVEEDEVEFKRIGWDSIGGMKSQIEAIRRKVEYPQQYKSLFKEFKLPLSKGILLYGPTGCGKTLIAKAIASSMLNTANIKKSVFIYLKGGELLSRYVGDSEQRIKSVFDSARRTYKTTGVRPIVFIDEAEAILPPRGSRFSSDVDTTIVPTFLSEMDGLEGENPFVLLATNYEDRIDSAILRPGRIDLKIYVGHPTLEDSVEIFKIHLAKTKVDGDMEKLALSCAKHLHAVEKLHGDLSGALIEGIVYQAIENAIARRIRGSKATGVIRADLIDAIDSK